MKDSQIINHLVKTNDRDYNMLKAAEELQELSLALTQLINKPNKVKEKEITDEIGDVKIRLKVLCKLFSKQAITDRIRYKFDKFKSYIKDGKYKGQI